MKTTTTDIKDLVRRIDRKEILLPEIQRGYVWKPTQVAYLIDSLYRKYPSGSLLLWETDRPVQERSAAITSGGQNPLSKPQYLLDGQQRLTSLHRVFTGHPGAQIVFNIDTERFQNQSAATRSDPRWVLVHSLLDGSAPLFDMVNKLSQAISGLNMEEVHGRLNRVRQIGGYTYYIEILDHIDYEQVTEIFVRVNSRGRRLTSVDLALATLTSRKTGILGRFSEYAAELDEQGYGRVNVGILTRALALLGTPSGTFKGFAEASDDDIENGWEMVKRGFDHLIPLLKQNADLTTSDLLPSITVLLPLVAYLGRRMDTALVEDEDKALIYWLFGALLTNHFGQSTDTVLAQDLAAIKSEAPLRRLFGNLGVVDRLVVTEEALAGRTVGEVHFMLSYLVARRHGAKDWWFGVKICTDAAGKFALQYHHIHPQARLRMYSKSERNDLANYAFISQRANLKISNRRPVEYFPEVGEEQLAAHLVPLDDSLRTPEAYPAFVKARRRLLAEAMTDLLDTFRPSWLEYSGGQAADPGHGCRLVFQVYAGTEDDPDGVFEARVLRHGSQWRTILPLQDVRQLIEDMSFGNGSDLRVGDDVVSIAPTDGSYDVVLGPLLVQGSADAWREVVDREIADRLPLGEMPPKNGEASHVGEHETTVAFPVSLSE
jgi:hypothetical protein